MTDESHPLAPGVRLRPAAPGDARSMAGALTRSRAHMRPWEPVRPEAYHTEQGQRDRLAGLLAERAAGRGMPWVLADDEDLVVGGFTLSNITFGAFHSATLGYWVDVDHAGRGLATAAVRRICETARDGLGLHRLEAGTVLTNTASQRVLAKTGFEEIGTARSYLHIAGEWADHRLFQRILHDAPLTG
ncbi:GNAT family N-acetyltransferase [Streptomyces sp. DT24]|uniref:GNAT family N-acetyltransferase n=1 Tax=Streptomyces sp. DT24 TaxID=3416520 RepID=UPI003CF40C7A